jgi:3-hydroxyisobutyrate dehydrogenase-like beta-hydroxyacid dehydrogenase
MTYHGIPRNPTVGILYAGEMGSTLGRVLAGNGLRVVTTLEGRGPRTHQRCREAGFEVLPSLDAVARVADLVVSLVPPSAALGVAREWAAAGSAGCRPCLFLDANAVSPRTAVAVNTAVAGPNVRCVDAAIQGLASQLQTRGLVYLSGPEAGEVARLLGRSLRVRVVGERVGQASALKMVLAGLAKGAAALFVEAALAAHAAGLAEPFLDRCREVYPGILEIADRLLPTFPRHAARRAEEMAEVESFLRSLGLEAAVAKGARRVIRALAAAGLEEAARDWTPAEVLQELHRCRALRRTRAAPVHP